MLRPSITRGVTAILLGSLLLFGCSFGKSSGEAPKLPGPYADLNRYWTQVSSAVGIDPAAGQLQQWGLSYNDKGSITQLLLVIYVDRGPSAHDVYSISQRESGTPVWRRTRIDGPLPAFTVPAWRFFSELNAVGYRKLEAQQGLAGPIRSWFHISSGTITYGWQVHTHVMTGGRIIPAGPEGVTMQGSHGAFQMVEDRQGAAPSGTTPALPPSATTGRPGESPPIYLIPEAGCAPESPFTGEVAHVWVCPGQR